MHFNNGNEVTRPASRVTGISAWVRAYPVVAAGALAMLGAAVFNVRAARMAERGNPPRGRFVEVDGVRLHYVERGRGEALVLLHGNGATLEDFETSGLLGLAARRGRVIAFDRPGFGYSARPRPRLWTADEQAALIHKALRRLGVSRAIVLGHSWGASVAMALALDHPETVTGVVFVSGYFYPTPRFDALALSGPGVPGAGDVLRHTVSPLLGRLLWPRLMRKIFGPAPRSAAFEEAVKEMALRPSQIRASAIESALLIPGAVAKGEKDYVTLPMPVAIVAGSDDRLVDARVQSSRLHEAIRQSTFRRVPGAGHMVHHAVPGAVMEAVDEVAAAARAEAAKGLQAVG